MTTIELTLSWGDILSLLLICVLMERLFLVEARGEKLFVRRDL